MNKNENRLKGERLSQFSATAGPPPPGPLCHVHNGWHNCPQGLPTPNCRNLGTATWTHRDASRELLGFGPDCIFQKHHGAPGYTISAPGPSGLRHSPKSDHLNLSGSSPVHHLVCPVTWIHLLLLPIHQPARAHPPCVPVCLESVTLPITNRLPPHPWSPFCKLHGDNREGGGTFSVFTHRVDHCLKIRTCLPGVKTVFCHPASSPFPRRPPAPSSRFYS